MEQDDDNSTVGYGRPPKASRFRPGQSGNPSGRPKGTRNFLSDLRAELQSTMTITERGRQLTVSKQLAIIKSLIAAAIDGDMRAMTAVVNISTRLAAAEDHQQDEAELSTEAAEILHDFDNRTSEVECGVNPKSSRNDDEI